MALYEIGGKKTPKITLGTPANYYTSQYYVPTTYTSPTITGLVSSNVKAPTPPPATNIMQNYLQNRVYPKTKLPVTQQPGGGTVTGGAPSGRAVTDGGGGGVPTVSGFPTYTTPQLNLNIPNFAWNPTETQRAGWQETAKTRAGLVIDPQRQAEIESLANYRNEVTSQIGEINPRMTKMSLALANIVENSMKQEIVDELIRRGATTSGELPRQLQEAGRYETEQRGAVETERNSLIGELMKGQLGRETTSEERLAELERLRGMQEASELFEQEKYERGQMMGEQQAQFGAQLSQAQLQNQIAAAQYDAAYQQKLYEAEMAQQTWERGFSQQQLELQQASQAYSQKAQVDPYEQLKMAILEQNLKAAELENQINAGIYGGMGNYNFYSPGSAGFKAGQTSAMGRY